MHKDWYIIRNEIITTLSRKSFIIFAFVIPVLAVFVFFIIHQIRAVKPSGSSSGEKKEASGKLQTEGYIDYAGLIRAIPDSFPPNILLPFPDEQSAREAMRSKTIHAYYIIPEDFIETGNLIYVNPDFNLISSGKQTWIMRRTLSANLLDNDPETIQKFNNVMNVKERALAPSQVPDTQKPEHFIIPYATSLIFVIVLLSSSSLLLYSISEEKTNRVMEILLSSITPRQILTGKILGLGILGLIQGATWVGSAIIILFLLGNTSTIPLTSLVTPMLFVWILLFFILGYFVYASLMAGLGALVPNMKEASQATILVIWPIVVSISISRYLILNPHGSVSTFLSLFPLTSPVVMLMRVVIGGFPWWQPLLAVAILILTILLILRAVSRMFHAVSLLSGQSFSIRRFYKSFLKP